MIIIVLCTIQVTMDTTTNVSRGRRKRLVTIYGIIIGESLCHPI